MKLNPYSISTPLSLLVIALVLAIAIIASLLRARRASMRFSPRGAEQQLFDG